MPSRRLSSKRIGECVWPHREDNTALQDQAHPAATETQPWPPPGAEARITPVEPVRSEPVAEQAAGPGEGREPRNLLPRHRLLAVAIVILVVIVLAAGTVWYVNSLPT